jgi:hypothetical protein
VVAAAAGAGRDVCRPLTTAMTSLSSHSPFAIAQRRAAIGSRGTSAAFDRIRPALIAFLSLHLAFVLAVKIGEGYGAQAWWMSHVALALTTAAAIVRSRAIAAAALACIAIPHAIWLLDAAIGLTLGSFPLRLTEYLATLGPWGWCATMHHVYLVPLLMWLVSAMPGRAPDARAVIASSGVLLLALTTISRAALPPLENVNFAFGAFTRLDHPAFNAINSLPAPAYLAVLNLGTLAFVVIPGAMLARALSRTR